MTGTPVSVGELVGLDFLNGVQRPFFDQTLSGDAATFDITSIVAGYAVLQVDCYLRTDRSGATSDDVICKVNNDGSTQCRSTRIYGNGSSASSDTQDLTTGWNLGLAPGNTAGSDLYGEFRIWIPNYAGAHKKVAAVTWGFSESGNRFAGKNDCVWEKTDAITRLTLSPSAGTHFKAGSRVTASLLGTGS